MLQSQFLKTEVRKVGVLIGLENRDGVFDPWEFDPLCLRHFYQ